MRALYSKSGDVLWDKVSLGDKTLLSKSKGKCLQRHIRALQRVAYLTREMWVGHLNYWYTFSRIFKNKPEREIWERNIILCQKFVTKIQFNVLIKPYKIISFSKRQNWPKTNKNSNSRTWMFDASNISARNHALAHATIHPSVTDPAEPNPVDYSPLPIENLASPVPSEYFDFTQLYLCFPSDCAVRIENPSVFLQTKKPTKK